MMRKMPKMKRGNNGIMTFSMVLTMMSLKSSKMFLRLSFPSAAMPKPRMKAKMSDVMTSSIGGMLIVKYAGTSSASVMSMNRDVSAIKDGKRDKRKGY